MLRKRFKEEKDTVKKIADDLGIETLTLADLKKTFTDTVEDFIKDGYYILACKGNRLGEYMSCYFTKDGGNSFRGLEMFKSQGKHDYLDTITITEVEGSNFGDFSNSSEVDEVEFYYLDDNHIYNSAEDCEAVDDELDKIYRK